MKVKIYQALVCYKNFNTTTPICESLEKLNELLAKYKDYLFYERQEIIVEIENGKAKSISYNCLDVD